ncbi:DNA internalization-related competence protein ComEC/Rec2 [Desulfovibrio litoralis]|uniref:Competence protein ComEC n=1 Tax=Desulfovibrio litoralis DSM 11393 TaxID=1121455 RepID=A0A1M7RX94_9BACT|nr:DNA internalization-related competence protein ComEC/Rec2 [Desulfovibrio litoralis]SHN50768.1 competence protein ComEC [Desulfovibrio litoralis DSM 11393]
MKKDEKNKNDIKYKPWLQPWSSLGTWHFLALSFICALFAFENIQLSLLGFFFIFLFGISSSEKNQKIHTPNIANKEKAYFHSLDKKQLQTRSILICCVFFLSLITVIKITQLPTPKDNQITNSNQLNKLLDENSEEFKKGQELTFKLESVRGLYDGRLRLIISELQPTQTPKVITNNTQDESKNANNIKAVLTLDNVQNLFGADSNQTLLEGTYYSALLKLRKQRSFKNENTTNSDEYWNKQGIFYRCLSVKNKTQFTKLDIRVQQDLSQTLQKNLSQHRNNLLQKLKLSLKPELSDARGIVYALISGDRQFISSNTASLFQRSALIHSLALSGLHLSLVFVLSLTIINIIAFFKPTIYLKQPRIKLAFLLSLPLGLIYLWLGAFSPSLIRAMFMLTVAAFAVLFSRLKKVEDALVLTVLLVAIIETNLIFELSFQLSVLSIFAIILFLPLIQLGIEKMPFLYGRSFYKRCLRAGLTILLLSFSIQIFLLPITSFYFGEVPIFFFLNVIWIPVLTFLVLPLAFIAFVFAALSFNFLSEQFFSLSALICDLFLNLLIFLNNHEWLNVFTPLRPLPSASLAFWILAILMIVFITYRFKQLKVKVIHQLILVLAFALSLYPVLLRYSPYSEAKQNIFSIKMLDVGQAQALLIESFGQRLICDGGGFNSKYFDSGKHIITPILTYNQAPRLDFIVNTHPDNDHLKGLLYLLENFSVKRIAFNTLPTENSSEKILHQIIKKNHLNIEYWRENKRILFSQKENIKIYIEVLYPNNSEEFINTNENSLVLRFVKEETNNTPKGLMIVLGDLQQKGLKRFLSKNQILESEVLILPHHGSESSLNLELYQRVKPKIALASTGYGNNWGFPSKKVREALKNLNIPLRVIGEEGEIIIKTEELCY